MSDLSKEIPKLLAGFRAAKCEPDFLVFIEGEVDWTWDMGPINGCPVVRIPYVRSMNDGRGDPCPWILGWRDEADSFKNLAQARFFEGYDEYSEGGGL